MFHFEGNITKKSLNIWPFPKLYIILPPDLHIQSQKFIANNEFYDKNNLLPKSLRQKNFI